VASFGLLGGLVVMTAFAGPMMGYAEATAAQLFAPQDYIETVLERADK
jgi:multicomponent K+:H+ antiporter subunit D